MEKPALQEFLATNLPFTIVTASGERYEVAHPDFVSIAPGAGTTVIVFGKDGVGFSLLDLTTISDVQLTSAASQP